MSGSRVVLNCFIDQNIQTRQWLLQPADTNPKLVSGGRYLAKMGTQLHACCMECLTAGNGVSLIFCLSEIFQH